MTILYGIYLIANFMQALYPRQNHRNTLNIQTLQGSNSNSFAASLERFSANTEAPMHSNNGKPFLIAP